MAISSVQELDRTYDDLWDRLYEFLTGCDLLETDTWADCAGLVDEWTTSLLVETDAVLDPYLLAEDERTTYIAEENADEQLKIGTILKCGTSVYIIKTVWEERITLWHIDNLTDKHQRDKWGVMGALVVGQIPE